MALIMVVIPLMRKERKRQALGRGRVEERRYEYKRENN